MNIKIPILESALVKQSCLWKNATMLLDAQNIQPTGRVVLVAPWQENGINNASEFEKIQDYCCQISRTIAKLNEVDTQYGEEVQRAPDEEQILSLVNVTPDALHVLHASPIRFLTEDEDRVV